MNAGRMPACYRLGIVPNISIDRVPYGCSRSLSAVLDLDHRPSLCETLRKLYLFISLSLLPEHITV